MPLRSLTAIVVGFVGDDVPLVVQNGCWTLMKVLWGKDGLDWYWLSAYCGRVEEGLMEASPK